jgi:hypothetical protein
MWVSREEFQRLKERILQLESFRRDLEYFKTELEYPQQGWYTGPIPFHPLCSIKEAVNAIMDYLKVDIKREPSVPPRIVAVKEAVKK